MIVCRLEWLEREQPIDEAEAERDRTDAGPRLGRIQLRGDPSERVRATDLDRFEKTPSNALLPRLLPPQGSRLLVCGPRGPHVALQQRPRGWAVKDSNLRPWD